MGVTREPVRLAYRHRKKATKADGDCPKPKAMRKSGKAPTDRKGSPKK